ncbi:hypothetical protein D1871_21940 [Nakamurella silvestris]|nr:hypothetical protein D1871_21940 [Nakamurella silvestris]
MIVVGRKSAWILVGTMALLAASATVAAADPPGPATAVRQTTGPVVQLKPVADPAASPAQVTSWGLNSWGQLGDGTHDQHLAPILLTQAPLLGKPISGISTGNLHTCAITIGTLWCWGSNQHGEMGNGTTGGPQDVPQQVKGALSGRFVTSVSVGDTHICAVANGTVFCWGANTLGEIGNNSTTDVSKPVAIAGTLAGKVVTSVSVGTQHTCAVANGAAYCWGRNVEGELGYLTDENISKVPQQVTQSDGGLLGHLVTSIGTGQFHTCALADGRVYCWGYNAHGQLGIGPHGSVFVPFVVKGLLKDLPVKALSVGLDENCVIAGVFTTRNGFCWGRGGSGRLGDGGNTDRNSPVALKTTNTPVQNKALSAITIDDGGGCVLVNGKGYCWGDIDKNGRLGFGSALGSTQAVPVKANGALADHALLRLTTSYDHSAGIAVVTRAFTDVPQDYPFHDDINWLAGSTITTGFVDGTYRPTNAIDRQAMAAFLYRSKNPGSAPPTCTGTVFTDVGPKSPFCGEIEWIADKGLLPPGGLFHPLGVVTRETMANWIFRITYANLPDQKCAPGDRLFKDVPAQFDSCGNIEWFAHAGITTGFSDGSFQPFGSVNRDSMAAFFHRVLSISDN